MKKIIASILMMITIIFSLSTFTLAQVSIKSIINTAGSGNCVDIAIPEYLSVNDPRIFTLWLRIQQFNCHNGMNQKFFIEPTSNPNYSTIQSVLNPKFCVGKNGEEPSKPGDLIGMYPCRNCSTCDLRPNVMWKVSLFVARSQFYRLEHAIRTETGDILCLDIPFSSPFPRGLQLYPCHNDGNQQWTFIN